MLSRQSTRALRDARAVQWPYYTVSRGLNSIAPPPKPTRLLPPRHPFNNLAAVPVPDPPPKDSEKTPKNHPPEKTVIINSNSNAPRKVEREKGATIFSGIQPTGVPHLGNYLGALRQWVKFQDSAGPHDKLYYSVVDLHAVTVPQMAGLLAQQRIETYASLLAIGLDPKRSVIFSQQDVLEHTQLMWLLNCHASMGSLSRMTQWKSKSGVADNANPLEAFAPNKPALKLGLFSYPVLQAADVLLYRTTDVPVGEDQVQHIEFARDLANTVNVLVKKHADPSHPQWEGFPLPRAILSPARRIMSLLDPTKKMSKSDPNPLSRVLITDSREDITRKILSARTDSLPGIYYNPKIRPGVANLIDIMYHMNESKYASPEALADEIFNADVGMKGLKEQVAKTVADEIEPIRERYLKYMARPDDIAEEMEKGAETARVRARVTLDHLKVAMGLRRPPVPKAIKATEATDTPEANA